MWPNCTDCIYAWLKSDHNVNQNTSQTAVWLQCILSPLIMKRAEIRKSQEVINTQSRARKVEKLWSEKIYQAASRWATSSWTLRSSRIKLKQTNQIQHETSVLEAEDLFSFFFFFSKPTSCSSAAGSVTGPHLSLFDMLPLHLFFPPLDFLWELRLLSGVSPDKPERVTSEQPANATVHKDTKTQRWGQTMRCGARGVSTRRGAELWRWQRLPPRMSPWHIGRNNGDREDVTKQIKSESLNEDENVSHTSVL